MSPDPLRLAIVGCGAIAELGHLPATRAFPGVAVTLLVDRDRHRAEALAKQFAPGAAVSADFAEAPKHADAAIVAVPPHLHAPIAKALLAEGVHVLAEKPLARTAAECDEMIGAAESSGAVLAVAMQRRFCQSTRFLQQALKAGILGNVRSFSIENGTTASWPTKSLYFLHPEMSGGGVLISNACHDLDLAIALFGAPSEIECSLDSPIRMEANCLLDLKMTSGVRGTIETSLTRDLGNRIRIEGERGVVEGPLLGATAKLILGSEPELTLAGEVEVSGAGAMDFYLAAMREQLDDFVSAIRTGKGPTVPGTEGQELLRWIEHCYVAAKALDHPWNQPIEEPAAS